jgi:predicted Zn-dependent protease
MSPRFVPAVYRIIRGATLLVVIFGIVGYLNSPTAGRQTSVLSYSHSELVDRVSQRLISQPEVVRYNSLFSFNVLFAPEKTTAFIIPTGQIFITSGLLDGLETEDQLAAVLAHEMAHFILDHFQDKHEDQMLSVDVKDDFNLEKENNSQKLIRQNILYEIEADFWGMCLLQQAGYHPEGFIELIEILAEEVESSTLQSSTSKTHPKHEYRIWQIEKNLNYMEHCFSQDAHDFIFQPVYSAP